MPDEDTTVDTAEQTPEQGNVEAAPTPSESEDVSIAAVQEDMRAAMVPPEGETPQSEGEGEAETGSTADSTTIQVDASQSGFGTLLKEAGLEHNYADDAAAAQAFVELRKTLSQRDEYAKLGKAIAPEYQSFQEWKVSQNKAEQPAQETPAWNPPEVNKTWLSELQKPEAEQDPIRAQKASEYMGYVQDKWYEYMQEPQKLVQEVVMPMVQEQIAKERETVETRSAIETLISSNKDLVDRYTDQLNAYVQQGGELEAGITILSLREQLSKAKGGETQIPEATPPAATGIVNQAPVKEEKEDVSDSQGYTDIQAIKRSALKAGGYRISPSGIG